MTDPTLPAVVPLAASIFGLAIGSFLNVVAYRVPAGISLLRESRCPGCDGPVRPWQNVPVLSWLALRGRCASCGGTISWRYPAVELGRRLETSRPCKVLIEQRLREFNPVRPHQGSGN